MSFFGYVPPPHKQGASTQPPVPSDRVIIDGTPYIKVVEDNPDLEMGRFDTGHGMSRQWSPLNYNPKTGVIEKWA